MEARRGGRRKPVITIGTAGEGQRIAEVQLIELPHIFGRMQPGGERTWLQYVRDDLSMVHRTYYLAELEWDGRRLHQIETEYYEPEFPEARLWMQEWIEETDEAWRVVMWGQRYPNASAELHAYEDGMRIGRRLRPGEGGVDAETVVLDSCGQFQAPCLRLWQPHGNLLYEYYVDAQGACLYGRCWTPVGGDIRPEHPGSPTLERGGRRWWLAWEQIVNRLVRAIW